MKIFVSYRRTDTAQIAGRIFDRFVATYGHDNVFKDVDSISLGADFRVAIEESIARCDVMVLLIGLHWLDLASEHGRRLDDPTDFVRLEIEGALAKSIRIIPLLVDGARMPTEAQLPASLGQLAFRHGTVVRPDPDFHRDVERIVKAIGVPAKTLPEPPRSPNDQNWHLQVDSGFQIRVMCGPMTGQVFPLNRARFVVGRGRDCDIVLAENDITISRFALALEWDWNTREHYLQSFSSSHIITVNTQEVLPHQRSLLAPPATIRLGRTVLRYEKTDTEDRQDLREQS
jgi:hypothetical protein